MPREETKVSGAAGGQLCTNFGFRVYQSQLSKHNVKFDTTVETEMEEVPEENRRTEEARPQ